MYHLGRFLFQPTQTRRAMSTPTLAMYCMATFGVPLPASPRKSGDEPYPCQSSRCGCMSAEQFWRSCCCTTLEERLAWAERNNVTPPDYVTPSTGGWRSAPRREAEEKPGKNPCCSRTD